METEHRSIVGKSMHLVTKLFVEGSNPVRELAKSFSNPRNEHWKAVEKFAGYLKENEDDIKLTYRKPKELRMVSSVDSNYATDEESRRSVSGNLLYMLWEGALRTGCAILNRMLRYQQRKLSTNRCQRAYRRRYFLRC